jgi:hypothetical protein
MDRIVDADTSPVVPHRTALLVLVLGGLGAFAAWQVAGVTLFLVALSSACL